MTRVMSRRGAAHLAVLLSAWVAVPRFGAGGGHLVHRRAARALYRCAGENRLCQIHRQLRHVPRNASRRPIRSVAERPELGQWRRPTTRSATCSRRVATDAGHGPGSLANDDYVQIMAFLLQTERLPRRRRTATIRRGRGVQRGAALSRQIERGATPTRRHTGRHMMVSAILKDVAQHIAIRPQYDNFIGGKWVAAGQRPVFRQHLADQRPGRLHRSPAPRPKTSNSRSTPPTPPRTPGAAPRRPSAPTCCCKIADRMEEKLDLLAMVETDRQRQADPRDDARRPAARRSTISAISPAACAPRKAASAKSTTTPSPIISTSRWASSARSSRGTSRC